MSGGFFDQFSRLNARRPAAPAPTTGGASTPLSVWDLTQRLKRVVTTEFPAALWVRGEVSNAKRNASSGHLYFTLKDPKSCIDCVMFRDAAAAIPFELVDGMALTALAKLNIYPDRGRYQLYVEQLELVGQGALEAALRQLRAKLAAEGLFKEGRKRPIPRHPRGIAIITSRQAAAFSDMLKVLRPFKWLRIFLHHVPVQGAGAGDAIAQAVDNLSRWRDQLGIDVILLGRGGGSLEDLWEFNAEAVARAVFRSAIPVVTGIGHETDVSIADLVADYHAHTPTEAARIVTSHWADARTDVDEMSLRLRRELSRLIASARQRLAEHERHEIFRKPLERVARLRQTLDARQDGLALAWRSAMQRRRDRLALAARQIERISPHAVVARLRQRLSFAESALSAWIARRLRLARQSIERLGSKLAERHPRHHAKLAAARMSELDRRLQRMVRDEQKRRLALVGAFEARLRAVGPREVLARGYSITTIQKSGQIVRSAAQVRPGEQLLTRLGDGEIASVAGAARQLSLFES